MPRQIDEEKLFDAVIEALVAGGYGQATTKMIAEKAGVNEVTLFRKYGSKAGLVRAALGHILETSALHDVRYSGELQQDLEEIVGAYLETNARYGDVIPTIISEMPRYPELREMMTPFLEVIGQIADVLARYQQEGCLKGEEGLASVSALLGPIIVGRMIEKNMPDVDMGAFEVREYVERYLGGRAAE